MIDNIAVGIIFVLVVGFIGIVLIGLLRGSYLLGRKLGRLHYKHTKTLEKKSNETNK